MSYVHPYSKRCEKSEVDLFTVPPTQLSLEKGRWFNYHPLSSVQDNENPITFVVAGTDEYLDLSKTILVVKGKVKTSGGQDLSGGGQANISPTNNFLHSLIKQVDVYLNGKQVTPAIGTYPYRSYIETLLNYDVSAKESQLSSALYIKDTAGEMDETGGLPSTGKATVDSKSQDVMLPGTKNQGFAKRREYIADSKEFVVSGPIFSDVFMSDRLLLNRLELKVVLNRSPNAFCLFEKGGSVNPKVELQDVTLKIRKVKVDQAIQDATEQILRQTPALYPIRRVECKALTIMDGLTTVRHDNIFSGIIPTSFVFGLVGLDAYNGTYDKNPYNFAHFNVKTLTLSANGEEIPFKQLTLEYPDDADSNKKNIDFIQAYNTLFSGTGKMYANAGLDISRDEYAGGFALYCFDLTPDMCNDTDYFNVVQRGSLTVDLTFRKATTKPIAMVCYGDFENIIRIDSERNVIYDIS